MRLYVVHGGRGRAAEKDHPLTLLSLAAPHQPDHAASDPDLLRGVGWWSPRRYGHTISLEPVNVTSFGKRDFADIITVRILR